MKSKIALTALALLATPALGEPHAHHAPYAGLEQRQIKALSDEQIGDLRAGRGMSLALAAELNGYPGPKHALELADALELTQDQRARTESLFGEMERRAAALGARLIEAERRLDALFAGGVPTAEAVAAATAGAASLNGELRALHLKYHLEMRDVLSAQQIARYNELRGYRAAVHR